MNALPFFATPPMQARPFVVLSIVLAAHAGALWLLQHGLHQRPVEALVPAAIVVEWLASPTPTAAPEVQAPPVQPAPAKPRPPRPTPKPVAVAPVQPTPAPVVTPVSEAPAPTVAAAAPVSPAAAPTSTAASAPAVAVAPVAPPAPPTPRLELPSANADYLNNPRPAYPALSKRLGEQGKVVLRVFIEVDGRASHAEIRTSSGYDRLDQTALQTVLRWRYVPGKRNGAAEAMWFNVPINFVLE